MLYPDGARELGRHRSLIVTSVPVQQQEGSTDCGLFAIANAFHAALGDSVSGLHFDQGKMREHLSKCFEQGQLTPFPKPPERFRRARESTISFTYFASAHCRRAMTHKWCSATPASGGTTSNAWESKLIPRARSGAAYIVEHRT